MYIERWLKAPAQNAEGTLIHRTKGTPQGGVISPLLANLFLHYAFDEWMKRNYPQNPFERYADDGVVHCKTETEANQLKQIISKRLEQCKLELHPEKTKVVYCKDPTERRAIRMRNLTSWAIHIGQEEQRIAKENTSLVLAQE